MKIEVKRSAASSGGTRGTFFINGEQICRTIEPSPHVEHPCIPTGNYSVLVTYSPKFKKPLPLLIGVKGRSGIRIHGGTRPEHTQGCICVPLDKLPSIVERITSAINNHEEVRIYITDHRTCIA